jgi:hypothetical protein
MFELESSEESKLLSGRHHPSPRTMREEYVRRAHALCKVASLGPVFLTGLLMAAVVGILYLNGSNANIDTLSTPQLTADLRWGIAGLGRISSDFAVALQISGANLAAVRFPVI